MTSLPTPPLKIAVAGAGTVATAVASLLTDAGHDVAAVASRTDSAARTAADRLGAPVVAFDELPPADVVLLGVPHGALAPVAASLGDLSSSVVVHFAGSAGVTEITSVRQMAACCALHPVQACPDPDTARRRLPGSAWGVTCTAGAYEWAEGLVREGLGGTPIRVREEDRIVWHAAAVATSNGIAALMATGESLLAALGVSDPERVLGPIAAGTVTNAREGGGGGRTLTGPVVRGEADVISGHVNAVARDAEALLPAYLDTLRMIVSSARAAGRISEGDEARLREVLAT